METYHPSPGVVAPMQRNHTLFLLTSLGKDPLDHVCKPFPSAKPLHCSQGLSCWDHTPFMGGDTSRPEAFVKHTVGIDSEEGYTCCLFFFFLHNLKYPCSYVNGWGEGKKARDVPSLGVLWRVYHPTGLAEMLEVCLSAAGSLLVLACLGARTRADRLNPV